MNEIEMRVEKARELHSSGCNCCQSVVLTYADKLPVDDATAARIAQPFGRGISGMRETCGCVTGMAIVCGLCNQSVMVKGLCEQFKAEHGSLSCQQLLQKGAEHLCNDLVASAARFLGEAIL